MKQTPHANTEVKYVSGGENPSVSPQSLPKLTYSLENFILDT